MVLTNMIHSVRGKFIIFSTLFITLSVGIPLFFLINQIDRNFDQRSRAMLITTLDMLHYGLYHVMTIGEHKNVQGIVDGISLNNSIRHLRLFDHSGRILYSSNKEEIGKNVKKIDPNHVTFGVREEWNIKFLRKQGSYSATEPLLNKPVCQSCHGDKKVIAFIDIDADLTTAESQFNTGISHIIYLGIFVTLLLILGLYIFFNNFVNKPIKNFIAAFAEVKGGNLNLQLEDSKIDEFGILNKHFNSMVTTLNNSKTKLEEMHLEQLQRTDKLVTLGELTSETAHEINNYSAIIMSRVDYLNLEFQQNEILYKYSEDLQAILNQIKNINLITGNILKHSKDSSQTFEVIDLLKVVDESVSLLNPLINKKGVSLLKKFDTTDSLILGNSILLEQAFTNLIFNSIDFLEVDGEIIISARTIQNSKLLELSFSDNGCGIEEMYLDQIFSPFFTTKTKERGTGLGLYIVKKICDKHNAEIRCSSSVGNGTTFTILFKLDRKL